MSRESFLKLLLLLTFVTFVVFRILVIPEQEKRDNFAERFSEARLEHKISEQKIKIFNRRKEEVNSFLGKLPPGSEMAVLARDLIAIADSNGISWERMSFRPFAPVADDIYALEFTMPVSGEYLALRRFIAEVERIRQLVNIEAISNLRLMDDRQMRLDLRMVTYFRESHAVESEDRS